MATNVQESRRPSLSVEAMGRKTSLSTVQTVTIPTGAETVILQAVTKDVRVTLDGSTPSHGGGTPTGFILYAGQPAVEYPIASDTVIKAIETSASAELQYWFKKYN